MKRSEQRVETTQEVVARRATNVGEPDSPEYLAKLAEHEQFITIYGRKTVREALRDRQIRFRHIYMDERVITTNSNVSRNEADPVVLEILDLIRERNIKLIPADKMRIAFISKSGKQDGGIVADLFAPPGSKLTSSVDFLAQSPDSYTILALDQITTPANMGMIIRSAVASQSFDAILVGDGSVSVTNPMVIKASASTALMAAKSSPLLKSSQSSSIPSSLLQRNTAFVAAKEGMFNALTALRKDGADIVLLAAEPIGIDTSLSRSSRAEGQGQGSSSSNSSSSLSFSSTPSTSLWEFKPSKKTVFVIGGESSGHDPAVEQVSNLRVHIPMAPGVESLNVAATASLISFAPHLRKSL